MKIEQTTVIIALAAGLVVSSAAAAQQERVVTGRLNSGSADGRTASAVVPYGDLDLASASGARALNQRVYRAATRLCIDDYVQPMSLRQEGMACRDDAIAGAQDQIAAAISRRGRLAGASVTLFARR